MDEVSHILVVEDNQSMSSLIGYVLGLQPEKYRVSFAYDGIQGIELALELQPDLILLDIKMPRLNGYQVIQHLRGLGNTTPIIILSAESQDEDRTRGYACGCNDFLSKPFQPNILCSHIREQLSQKGKMLDQSMRAS